MDAIKKVITNEFNERVLIKRIFLDEKSFSKERLYLLAKFLNKNNVSLKKLLKINNSSTYFKVYNYSTGYIFEGRLFYNDNSNEFLSNIRFKKTIKLFEDIFEKGFIKDDPLLTKMKSELLAENEVYLKDSFFFMESKLNLPYSKLIINEENLNNVSTSDLYNTLNALKKEKTITTIYIGKDIKKIDFNTPFFLSEKVTLPLDYSLSDNITYNNSYDNETLASCFTFKTIDSLDDFYKTYIVLKAISLAFENSLANFLLKCHSTIRIISKNKAVILYKFDNSSLYENNSRILSLEKEINIDMIKNCLNDALRGVKISQISLNSDLSTALKRVLLLSDLDILDSKLFEDINYDEDELKKKVDDIVKVNTFAIMKGKDEND